MSKSFEFICTNLVFVLLLMAPASAQFEVNPDHFEGGNSEAAAASPAELQVQIRKVQAQLLSYKAQLNAKAESVEEARRQAISAGIQGDGAANYFGTYEEQCKKLELLKKTLSVRIEETQNTISGLQAQLTLIATQKDPPQRRPDRGKNAKTRIVAQRTTQ